MGFILKTLTVITSIGVIFLAYHLFQPIPSDCHEPLKVRIIAAGVLMGDTISTLAEKLGISTWPTMMRLTSYAGVKSMEPIMGQAPDPGVKVTETTFNGVRVRLYDPVGTQDGRPGLVFLHGGGWVLFGVGKNDLHYPLAEEIARKLGVFVVFVDYRLAPEYPFPTPLDDCVKSTLYFMKNAHQFRVHPKRIGIAGDSAGGNLAAAVALKLREIEPNHQLKLQALLVPVLQGVDLNTPSYQDDTTLTLTKERMAKFIAYYLGTPQYIKQLQDNAHLSAAMKKAIYEKYLNRNFLPSSFIKKTQKSYPTGPGDQDAVRDIEATVLDPYFSPLLAENLKGLPKCYLYTAGYDVLRDDGFLYAYRLKKAGVPVEHVHLKDAVHLSLWCYEKSVQSFLHYLEENL